MIVSLFTMKGFVLKFDSEGNKEIASGLVWVFVEAMGRAGIQVRFAVRVAAGVSVIRHD